MMLFVLACAALAVGSYVGAVVFDKVYFAYLDYRLR